MTLLPPALAASEPPIRYFEVKNELHSPVAFQRAIAHLFMAIESGKC